jgi:hypothetical protein
VTQPFNAQRGLIVIPVLITGPNGPALVDLAVDTGSTRTTISIGRLTTLGYDPAASGQQRTLITGGGVISGPVITLVRIEALGQVKTGFPVVGLTLPAGTSIDGVLGLDFVRGRILNIDFRQGQVGLS